MSHIRGVDYIGGLLCGDVPAWDRNKQVFKDEEIFLGICDNEKTLTLFRGE